MNSWSEWARAVTRYFVTWVSAAGASNLPPLILDGAPVFELIILSGVFFFGVGTAVFTMPWWDKRVTSAEVSNIDTLSVEIVQQIDAKLLALGLPNAAATAEMYSTFIVKETLSFIQQRYGGFVGDQPVAVSDAK